MIQKGNIIKYTTSPTLQFSCKLSLHVSLAIRIDVKIEDIAISKIIVDTVKK
jgi:hypothetical protein